MKESRSRRGGRRRGAGAGARGGGGEESREQARGVHGPGTKPGAAASGSG